MAIKKLQGLDAIRRWVVKTFLKEKEQTGVMVNLPKKDFVDLNTSITAERLMRNGIDPNSIKSEDQVENIINQLNDQIKKPRVVSQGDPEFKGIMSKMMGSNVIKADFGKPFKEEIKKMETEATNPRFLDYTIKSMLKMEPIDAMKEANKVIKREGSYKNLSEKEAKKILDDTEDHIFERNVNVDPEDMADGGRIGYKLGTFKKIGEGVKSFAEFLNKKNPVQAYTDYLKSIKDKTLKANKTGKFTDLPLAEVGIPAAGGMLINRAVKKKLEAMSKEDVERKKERDDKAYGGRIGFKKGMDRRTFMKMVGGLTALPILGKLFKGAEIAAPVAEKAVEAAKTVPPYFFDLVNKIKIFGKQRTTPSYKERVNEYTYTGKDGIEYELVEDLDTGDIIIKKDKMGVASSGDESYDVIEDRTEMVYKKGQADETTKGTPADEYDEYKVEFDQDGTAADATEIDEVSKMEIIKEVSGDAPPIKKASGGVAMMLGE